MMKTKKWIILGFAGAAAAVILRWFFPALAPFLVGFAVAEVSEPGVRLLTEKGRFSRAISAGITVTLAYSLLLGLVYGLGRLAFREMDSLSGQLPDLVADLEQGASRLENWLLSLAEKAPERIRPGLTENIRSLFSDTSALTASLSGRAFSMATRLVGSLPDAFVFLGTAVTAGFLISARLPDLKSRFSALMQTEPWRDISQSARKLRHNVGLWLRAEAKLMGLTFAILAGGFLFLRRGHAILLAGLVCLVDALPILGTGTVLLPWAGISLIRGENPLAFGLLALYGITALGRSFLEPRLIGRQLGMNPLLTLGAVYLGYRFWGFLGMVLAPVLWVSFRDLWVMGRKE